MVKHTKTEEIRLQKSLNKFKLSLIEELSKGFSSRVFKVKNNQNKIYALKIERDKSPREQMTKKETINLRLANSHGIGPKLIETDLENRTILMEFIDGKTFSNWLFNEKLTKKKLHDFLKELLQQAQTLDLIGLDHGQLAGKGANILVKNNKPIIIDFEKASQNRKTHNKTQLESFLFINPNSIVVKRIKEFELKIKDFRE